MSQEDFSLNDFRKWISSKNDEREEISRKPKIIGWYAEPKLSSKRLAARMSVNEGNLREMAKEFKKYGGIILEVDSDDNLLIELDSGTFRIPRYFTRVRHP